MGIAPGNLGNVNWNNTVTPVHNWEGMGNGGGKLFQFNTTGRSHRRELVWNGNEAGATIGRHCGVPRSPTQQQILGSCSVCLFFWPSRNAFHAFFWVTNATHPQFPMVQNRRSSCHDDYLDAMPGKAGNVWPGLGYKQGRISTNATHSTHHPQHPRLGLWGLKVTTGHAGTRHTSRVLPWVTK